MAKHVLTNEDAQALVSRSIYLEGKPDYVVVLAVGYSRKLDHVYNRRAALEAFRELLTADDWEERTFQLWSASSGRVVDIRGEDLPQ